MFKGNLFEEYLLVAATFLMKQLRCTIRCRPWAREQKFVDTFEGHTR